MTQSRGLKGKALRRALKSTDVVRINTDLPAIVDTTELISPAQAQEMLTQNQNNRPVNWHRVEQYAEIMKQGKWQLHAPPHSRRGAWRMRRCGGGSDAHVECFLGRT